MSINDPAVTAMTVAKVVMMRNWRFIGLVCSNFEMKEVQWTESMSTDGKTIFYNRDFVLNSTPAQLVFYMAHQLIHVMLKHVGRRGTRNEQIWDMAIDYVANAILVEDKIGELPKHALYKPEFADKSADEIYELLKKNQTSITLPLDTHLDAQSSDGNNGKGSGEGDGGSITINVNSSDGKPTLSPEDIAEMSAMVAAIMEQTAASGGAGNVPKGLRSLLPVVEEPVLPWADIIHATMTSRYYAGSSYARYNKKNHLGCILPGKKPGNMIKCSVAFDLSGSMDTNLIDELRGIFETFQDYTVNMWTFDTEVYGHQVFSPQNIDEFDSYEPHGGGGTRFEANFEYMSAIEHVPDVFVMFTDGFPCGSWGDPNYCDTIFVIVDNPTVTAPYGQTVHYTTPTTTTVNKQYH